MKTLFYSLKIVQTSTVAAYMCGSELHGIVKICNDECFTFPGGNI